MQKLFNVDENGNFKIIAQELTIEKSGNSNGAFNIPILLTDLQGNSNLVMVNVELSNLLKQVKCPKIADAAMCKFSINRTTFDPSK